MPPPTTSRGILVIFPQGADPPVTNQRATTPPVRSLTSLSLRVILAAGAGGRGARGGASGRKGPREEGGISAREGGRNRDGTGWPHDKTETGRRTAAARRRTTEEQARGQRDQTRHQGQLISNGKGGEHRAREEGQEGIDDANEE